MCSKPNLAQYQTVSDAEAIILLVNQQLVIVIRHLSSGLVQMTSLIHLLMDVWKHLKSLNCMIISPHPTKDVLYYVNATSVEYPKQH